MGKQRSRHDSFLRPGRKHVESVAFLCVNSAVPFSASFGAPNVLNVDFRRATHSITPINLCETHDDVRSVAIQYDLNSAVSSRLTA